MSKTYLNQVEKVKILVEGARSHHDMVKDLGITLEQLDKMEEMSKEAERLNNEVESLRHETSLKVKEANARLEELKAVWLPMKNKIKSSYDQLKWAMLGIQDKR